MSRNVLWGECSLPGSLQPILTVDQAPLLDVADVPITTLIPFVVFAPILDVNGVDILTVNAAPLLAIDQGAEPPSFWATADVASDGGVPFGFRYRAAAMQPAGQQGEMVFGWCTIMVTWAAAAVIRLTPFVDGIQDDITLADGSTLRLVPVTFVLDQQGGNLEPVSQVFMVPLVREQVRNGVPVARWSLRGQRLEFIIESTGQIGSGELNLVGKAIKADPVRKAIYAPFVAGA